MKETDFAALIRDGVYDVVQHRAAAPDPGEPKYIKHSAQVIGAERFNDLQRPVRRVTISGVHLSFDTTDSRGVVREYNGKEDIKELYVIADTVVVSRALHFPQTDVFILCRALEFKGAEAVIDTTPNALDDQYRELLDKNGRNGPKAGNITLYVSKLTVDTPGLRFIARGGAGQKAEEGEISTTSTRKDLALITKEQWEGENGFSYAHRHVKHEAAAGGKGEFYTADMPSSVCDWETFQRQCGNSITYVKFTNTYWVDFQHEKRFGFQGAATETTTVFELGTTALPGEGGAGMPPGKPGTGGAGGDLTSTVPIDPKLRDLTGGSSAQRHPGTPGGAGGTPKNPCWVFIEGKPLGEGGEGAKHIFPYRIERKFASVGKASGPGPEADKPKGDDGKDIDAKDKCAGGWVTPLLLNIVIQYAKDVAASEQTKDAQALLTPYVDALAGRTNEAIIEVISGFPEEVVGGSHTMAQLRDEVTGLTARLDQHLDTFGNPPGWVPNLTLTGAVGAYDAVRDIALKELYGAYYLEKAWKAKEARENALKQLIDVLIEKTQQLKSQMIDTRRAIMQRGYVAPADPTADRGITVDDLAGAKPLENVPFDDMSLLERLRSLIAQMETLEVKRKKIETKLRQEADEKTMTELQWEAAQAGLKISGAALKALPLPPPYEQAAAAFGGLLEVTSTFMEKGVDNTAFEELKTQVKTFTETNQEQLVELFTKSMENELSAYNVQIINLEEAAKSTQKAKDEFKQQYDDKVNAANAERKAAIEALTDRAQQRLRQRQPTPDPANPKPGKDFKTEIAERALAITNGAGAAKEASEAYTETKKELKEKSEAMDAKKLELENKIKATTTAKKARAKSTKENIENVKKVVDGIEQIAKAINKLAVSETQLNTKWSEALAKIKSKDSEFQTYLTDVTYLNEQKKLVVGRLVKLLNDFQTQRQQIARNLIAINELRLQYAKGGADDLDHGTLLYIQGMREDAHRRLTTFLYYVTRAYEYYTVRPWDQFYADARKIFEDLRIVLANPAPNLTGIFDEKEKDKDTKEKKLKALITTPTDPVLSETDFALLKGVYEKPLRDMGIRMLDELASGRERKIEEREQHVTLSSDDLRRLNGRIRDKVSARMTINLARLDQIRSGDEKQRLGEFKVVNAVVRRLSDRFPGDITFKVTHVGRSIVCYQGKFYAFEPQPGTETGRRSRGVTFETNGTPAKVKAEGDKLTLTGDALKQPESKAQETLVSKLLGPSASGSIDLSGFRPGAFSDFLLTVEFTPRECRIEFDEIEFVVMMEKGNTDTTAELVSVFNDRDLAIDISTSRSDRSGRTRAIGRYMGVYNEDEIENQPLIITVPGEYGTYRHTGWAEGVAPSSTNPHSCEVSAGRRVIAMYENYGTGGTFATDARNIGMSQSDIRELTEKLNFSGEKGVRAYQFKGKEYQVQYVSSGANTTLLSIQSYGTGGTFATDAGNIGMSQSDIQELTEKLNFSGENGVRAYQFKGKEYQVQYVSSGGNTTLLSIEPL